MDYDSRDHYDASMTSEYPRTNINDMVNRGRTMQEKDRADATRKLASEMKNTDDNYRSSMYNAQMADPRR